jgi:hypothetical protein
LNQLKALPNSAEITRASRHRIKRESDRQLETKKEIKKLLDFREAALKLIYRARLDQPSGLNGTETNNVG